MEAEVPAPLAREMTGTWAMHKGKLQSKIKELQSITPEQIELAKEHLDHGVDVETDGNVAVVPVHGMIVKRHTLLSLLIGGTSTEQVKDKVRQLEQDDDVDAIVLSVYSPGGFSHGVGDLADELFRIRGSKPIVAHIEDIGASAAYWIASQANHVIASPHAKVGSIGVYHVVHDVSEAAEEQGVKVHVVSTGERKGDLIPGTEITDDELDEVQRQIDFVHEDFVKSIVRGRSGVLNLDRAMELADGRVHPAESEEDDDAEDLGLIDATGSLRDAIRAAARTASGETVFTGTHHGSTVIEPDDNSNVDDQPWNTSEDWYSYGGIMNTSANAGTSIDPANDPPTREPDRSEAGTTAQARAEYWYNSEGGDPEAKVVVPQNPEGGSGEGAQGEWDSSKHASLSAIADWIGVDKSSWSEFTDNEKTQAHKAFADSAGSGNFTDSFDDDLNLPHHFTKGENSDEASINGARNALSRLPQTENLHSDEDEIESHLNAHLPDDEESKMWSMYIDGEVDLYQVIAATHRIYDDESLHAYVDEMDGFIRPDGKAFIAYAPDRYLEVADIPPDFEYLGSRDTGGKSGPESDPMGTEDEDRVDEGNTEELEEEFEVLDDGEPENTRDHDNVEHEEPDGEEVSGEEDDEPSREELLAELEALREFKDKADEFDEALEYVKAEKERQRRAKEEEIKSLKRELKVSHGVSEEILENYETVEQLEGLRTAFEQGQASKLNPVVPEPEADTREQERKEWLEEISIGPSPSDMPGGSQ